MVIFTFREADKKLSFNHEINNLIQKNFICRNIKNDISDNTNTKNNNCKYIKSNKCKKKLINNVYNDLCINKSNQIYSLTNNEHIRNGYDKYDWHDRYSGYNKYAKSRGYVKYGEYDRCDRSKNNTDYKNGKYDGKDWGIIFKSKG